jgi:hypothetical protein
MNYKTLPNSNHSPCECNATSGDRIQGIPDKVQRPARKEINVTSIGSKMKIDNKGYKIVNLSATLEPVGTGGKGMKKKKKYKEDDDDSSYDES